MTRISKNPEERREEIVSAARKLFFNKGYDNTSISDIVSEVGVAKGLFYYYFDSKYEIFEAALYQNANEYAQIVKEILFDNKLNVNEKMCRSIEMISILENDPKHENMKLEVLKIHEDLHEVMMLYFTEIIIKSLEELFENEINKIRIEKQDPEMLARFLAYGVLGFFRKNKSEIKKQKKIDIEEISKIFEKLLK